MKISGFDPGVGRIGADRPVPPASLPGAGKFGDILKQALGAVSSAAAESAAAAPLSATLPIRPVYPAPAAAAADRVESVLDLLEAYSQKLVDPRVDLKALDGAVREVEKGVEALKPALGFLPENDGLKEIANSALVAASVEIVKFRRGDYLG